jgi:hypothetical protein
VTLKATRWSGWPVQKNNSRQHTCEFNRDSGWAVLDNAGSAPRFRRVEFIQSMTRDAAGAISRVGEARAAKTQR